MAARIAVCVGGLVGCPSTEPSVPPPTPLELPEPWLLPAQELPDPFVAYRDGSAVQDWEARREELLTLFAHYVYGQPGPEPQGLETEVEEVALASGRLTQVHAAWSQPALNLTVSVFSPPGDGPFPAFVALNKCGNQSLGPWPEVPITQAWVPSSCPGGTTEESRGSRSASWPVDTILAAGWALVAVHQNELVADDRELGFTAGLLASVDVSPDDARSQWGAVGAWAWGLSRGLDVAEELDVVDADRVVPVGHSRRGKSALLAAARDRRFAAAIPHQSGTAGVTLSRSDGGESVASINAVFPHWFAPRFADFGDAEERLPLDQHLLVALVAPRPVLATDGDADDWADPDGARASIEAAAPVWEFLGAEGLQTDAEGAPTRDGALAWGTRPGGHSLEPQDWQAFLDWVAAVGL